MKSDRGPTWALTWIGIAAAADRMESNAETPIINKNKHLMIPNKRYIYIYNIYRVQPEKATGILDLDLLLLLSLSLTVVINWIQS